MQQVVLPSLWPRKKNTWCPPGEEEDGLVEKVRDVREEARREVEEERRGVSGMEEGLRWRNRGETRGFEMPGAMPGMMVA